MADLRKSRVDRIFESTLKRDDDPNSVKKSIWKEQYEKNVASATSNSKKLKKYVDSRLVSQTNAAASKEIPKPKIPINESSNNPKSSLKKPPFILPGKILYNDLHLFQFLPEVKYAKRTVTRTGVVKVTHIQHETSRQASVKTRSAANVAQPTETKRVSCPKSKKKSIPQTGLTVTPVPSHPTHTVDDFATPEQSAPPHPTITVDDFSAIPSTSFSYDPFITIDQRTSVQKSFSSLWNSKSSVRRRRSGFLEDGSDTDSSEYSDGESQPDSKYVKFSAPSGIPAETQVFSKAMSRKKHKSESNANAFFSSPHQSHSNTDSPRPRSHSTNMILDQPLVPTSSAKREKVVQPSRLLDIPKNFYPVVIQSPDRFGQTEELRSSPHTSTSEGPSPRVIVTRNGRISQSPNRFRQTEVAKVSFDTPK